MLTANQTDSLNKVYASNPKPSTQDTKQLAVTIGLPHAQVTTWFAAAGDAKSVKPKVGVYIHDAHKQMNMERIPMPTTLVEFVKSAGSALGLVRHSCCSLVRECMFTKRVWLTGTHRHSVRNSKRQYRCAYTSAIYGTIRTQRSDGNDALSGSQRNRQRTRLTNSTFAVLSFSCILSLFHIRTTTTITC